MRKSTKAIWSAVAKHSGDTAFLVMAGLPKRRGALLPAAGQDIAMVRVHPFNLHNLARIAREVQPLK
jgi:hypothetical protein